MQDYSCAPVLSQLHTARAQSSLDTQWTSTLSEVLIWRADFGHSNHISSGTAVVAAQLAYAYALLGIRVYVDVRRHVASGQRNAGQQSAGSIRATSSPPRGT